VISHPSFHNVTFKDAERMLRGMDPVSILFTYGEKFYMDSFIVLQGDAIVRPSGSSTNQLTVTWKVADEIYQHINIRESEKKNVFDIGKVLYIKEEVGILCHHIDINI
jgi:transcription elongation factor SPT6